MVDNDVLGCNWIKIPATKYQVRTQKTSPAPVSQCQMEVDIAFDQFVSYPAEDEWQKVAPYRILSFDIECAGRRGKFTVIIFCFVKYSSLQSEMVIGPKNG